MSLKNTITLGTTSTSRLSGYLEWIQMLSGAALVAFVWFHLLMVSTILISPERFNFVSHFYEKELFLGITMLHIGGPLIIIAFLVHAVVASRKMPFRAAEVKTYYQHSQMMKHPDTWTWLLQVISAMVILLLVTIHIWVNIKTLPINATTSATRMNAGGWWLVYVILLPMLGIHVSVGFYRICVKWGLFKRSGRPWFQRIEILMGLGFVLLGVITMLRFLALAP